MQCALDNDVRLITQFYGMGHPLLLSQCQDVDSNESTNIDEGACIENGYRSMLRK